MRKPTSITVSESYTLKAKKLKKGDPIWIGKRVYEVTSNTKDEDSKRVIDLEWGSKNESDSVTIVVPAKAMFHVRRHKTTRTQ